MQSSLEFFKKILPEKQDAQSFINIPNNYLMYQGAIGFTGSSNLDLNQLISPIDQISKSKY